MGLVKGTHQRYSSLAKIIHWVSAVTVLGLFFLGLWMVTLTYYHDWYQTAPSIHVSVGFALVCLTLFRIFYRLGTRYPKPLPAPRWQELAAVVIHCSFYAFILSMFVTGYLIDTAQGRPLEVFGFLKLPAVTSGIENLEDVAGTVHKWLAYVFIGLVCVHALAAFKHHFIDKDKTLRRMLRESD